MKKLLLAYYLFLCFTPISVAATAIQDLQNRLAKVNSFHSQFSQIIINSDGTIVQQGAGELWIKRPNLFNWHMISPDESMLISDGQTLWFYNPLVAQVTATWLKNTIFNTPFMLIIRNHATDWAQYWIKQKGDDFELVPKSSTGHVIKQCYITVTKLGIIRSFTVVEHSGQLNTYVLKHQNNAFINSTKFIFILPQGVILDEQRQ